MPKMKEDRPSLKNAVLAKCHSCMGEYADGMDDCENRNCSLYYWMPYRKQEIDRTWELYNPRRKGLVTFEESKRELTDEQREQIAERMRGLHQRNKDDTQL